MDRKYYNQATRHLKKENMKFSNKMVRLKESDYNHLSSDPMPDEVWRSRYFVAQIFYGDPTRISVNRTAIQTDGHWIDNITWDELNAIKSQCGYEDDTAVELYPPKSNIVNRCNIRHLWVLSCKPEFMWT